MLIIKHNKIKVLDSFCFKIMNKKMNFFSTLSWYKSISECVCVCVYVCMCVCVRVRVCGVCVYVCIFVAWKVVEKIFKLIWSAWVCFPLRRNIPFLGNSVCILFISSKYHQIFNWNFLTPLYLKCETSAHA